MTQIIRAYNDSSVAFLVDDEDYVRLNQYRWRLTGEYAFASNGEARGISMHRFLMAFYQKMDGVCVDHIDHDTFNNTKANLRIATYSQNGANQRLRANNTSGYKGVSRANNGWRSCICVMRKSRQIGVFDTAEEGALAYDLTARAIYGQYAMVNFSSPDIEVLNRVERWLASAKRRRRTVSVYYGVTFYKRWRAAVYVKGKRRHLGYHDTEEQAARAVDAELLRIGDSHLLNFPNL